jgi:hypothetical protein
MNGWTFKVSTTRSSTILFPDLTGSASSSLRLKLQWLEFSAKGAVHSLAVTIDRLKNTISAPWFSVQGPVENNVLDQLEAVADDSEQILQLVFPSSLNPSDFTELMSELNNIIKEFLV